MRKIILMINYSRPQPTSEVVRIFSAVLLLMEKQVIGATVLTSGVFQFLYTIASYVKLYSVAVANKECCFKKIYCFTSPMSVKLA